MLAGALAGVGAIGLGRAEDQAGPLRVSVATAPAPEGRTVVDLQVLQRALDEATGALSRLGLDDVVDIPETGSVSARTHSAPLLLRVTVTGVDPGRAAEILPRDAASVAGILAPLKTRLTATMTRLAARTLALGAAGGLLLSLLFRGRILGALAGIAGGAGAPAAIFAMTAATYDLDAFSSPIAASGGAIAAGLAVAVFLPARQPAHTNERLPPALP